MRGLPLFGRWMVCPNSEMILGEARTKNAGPKLRGPSQPRLSRSQPRLSRSLLGLVMTYYFICFLGLFDSGKINGRGYVCFTI